MDLQGVQFLPILKHSIIQSLLADSRLEFVTEPKFIITSLETCHLMECQLFSLFLPKSDGLKMFFGLVVLYFDFLMSSTRFFQLTLVFSVVQFLVKPYQKSFCESSLFFEFSLCSPPPPMVASNPLGAFPKYLQGLSLLIFTKMGFGSNLLMLTKSIVLLGRQYYILYEPSHHFLNFSVCSFLPFGNQKPMSPQKKS